MKKMSSKLSIQIYLELTLLLVFVFVIKNFPDINTKDYFSNFLNSFFEKYYLFSRVLSLVIHFINSILVYKIFEDKFKTDNYISTFVSLLFFVVPVNYEFFLNPSSLIQGLAFGVALISINLFDNGKSWHLIPSTLLTFVLNQSMLFLPAYFLWKSRKDDKLTKVRVALMLFMGMGFLLSFKFFSLRGFWENITFIISTHNTIFENLLLPINLTFLNVKFLNGLTPIDYLEFIILSGLIVYFILKSKQEHFIEFAILFFASLLGIIISPWSSLDVSSINIVIFRPSFYPFIVLFYLYIISVGLKELKKNRLKMISICYVFVILLGAISYLNIWSYNSFLINHSINYVNLDKVENNKIKKEIILSSFYALLSEKSFKQAGLFLQDQSSHPNRVNHPEVLWIELYAAKNSMEELLQFEYRSYNQVFIKEAYYFEALADAYSKLNAPEKVNNFAQQAVKAYQEKRDFESAKRVEEKYLK